MRKLILIILLFCLISLIGITGNAFALPDLTSYTPSGWSYPVVARTTTGCTSTACTPSSSFTTSNPIYINWAVQNSGSTNINTTFYTGLYIDGTLKQTWSTSLLSANYFINVTDYNIGTLSAGSHTIEIRTDTTSAIAESNESNNTYSFTVTVSAVAVPDIRIDPTSLTF